MFYDRRKLFAGLREKLATNGTLTQKQVEGIEVLLDEGERRNFNTEWIAYVLATAWHETAATMQPVRETLATTDAQAITRLDNAYNAGKLKNVSTPYWRTGFFGRGYVQLTHEFNYKKMGDWLGIDLVKNPAKAMETKTAAKIIYEGMLKGMFTAKKLSDYLDGIDGSDAEDEAQFQAARKTVNGADKAKLIAGYAVKFEKALRDSEGVAPVVAVKGPTKAGDEAIEIMEKAPQNETKPLVQSGTMWGALGSLAASIIGVLTNLPVVVQVLLILLVAGFVFWIIRERLKGNKNIEGLF